MTEITKEEFDRLERIIIKGVINLTQDRLTLQQILKDYNDPKTQQAKRLLDIVKARILDVKTNPDAKDILSGGSRGCLIYELESLLQSSEVINNG